MTAANARVLIVGADGLLGAAVAKHIAAQGMAVVPTTRRGGFRSLPLDLASRATSWAIPKDITAAVICAAVTSTAECSTRPADCRLVNVEATVHLAERLFANGVHVVFPSSNQVFDGASAHARADQPTSPRTVYGQMKAEAEHAILTLGGSATILRLTKILHSGLPLLAGWRVRLFGGQTVAPLSDFPVAPLSLSLGAAALSAAAIRAPRGILQLSATFDVSYAGVAGRLAAALDCRADLVCPVAVATSGHMLEHVPLNTTLDTSGVRELLGVTPPDPWLAVDQAVVGLRSSSGCQ